MNAIAGACGINFKGELIMREMLKSKIHGAVITKKEVNYSGSIGIDRELMQKADIFPGEKVQVLNFENGERFETYAIDEDEKSGTIALYGPAGRKGEVGDRICVISYAVLSDEDAVKDKPIVILTDKKNNPL